MDCADEFEKIFQTVTSVILGRKLAGHGSYEAWLGRNVSRHEFGKSVISGKPIYLPPLGFYQDVKRNIVTIEEAYEQVGKRRLPEEKLAALSFSNARMLLADLATTTPDTVYGKSTNIVDGALYYNSHNCLKGCGFNRSRCCLYCFWPRQSEYALGCSYLFSSRFCIKCYNSENLARCFEMSDCNSCSDSFFCHNCDNVNDSLFCFNAKNLRNAVGNVQLPPDEYKRVKAMVQMQLADELEKTKTLRWSIFNVGR